MQPTCCGQPSTSSDSGNEDIFKLARESALPPLNETLSFIGESPVKKTKMSQKKYARSKIKQINRSLNDKVFSVSETSEEDQNSEEDILENLKKAYSSTEITDRNRRIQILTLLPISWSIKKIEEHFNATTHMISVAKGLNKKGLIMCTPEQKKGKSLPIETTELVLDFYESEEVTRTMPGKKDFVTVVNDGRKEHVQKKLILCNIRELFRHFKNKYSDTKIGFSKFAELRPRPVSYTHLTLPTILLV